MAYRWDAASGRYRDRSGRFLSGAVVRGAVDNVADLSSQRTADLSQRLLDGNLSLADWQNGLMQEAKAVHVAAGIAARGGKVQMSQSDYGAIGRRLRDEYGYIRQFARDIAGGIQPLDGRLIARARQYGQAGRATFTAITARDQKNRGMRFEKNLMSADEVCAGCKAESEKGWRPIGSLKLPGRRLPCRVNCRCRLVYRRDEAVA